MKTAAVLITSLLASASGALDIATAEVRTCSTDADCSTHDAGGAGTCIAGTTATGGKCANCGTLFTGGGNTLNLCKAAATPATATMTMYYLLRNIADNTKVINCDNLDTFTTPYETLIKTAAAASFTTDEQNSMVITHFCHKPTAANAAHILRTSVKVDVNIERLLTVGLYTTLPTAINNQLTASTDTTLNSVGRVESALALRDVALSRFCTQTNGVYLPFAATLGDIANNECMAVSCTNGYSLDNTVSSPTCSGPGKVVTTSILTCGTNDQCTETGSTCSGTEYTCSPCSITTGGNTLKICGAGTNAITLNYVFTHGTMVGDSTKVVDCTKETTFKTPFSTLVKSVEAGASVVTICKNNKLSSVVSLTSPAINDVLAADSKYITFALDVNQKLIDSTDVDLKAVGGIESVHVGTKESFIALCPNSRETTLRAPLSYANYLHATNDKECAVVECLTDYTLTTANTCSYKIPAFATDEILTCGANGDCGVDNTVCNTNYRCENGGATTCNHFTAGGHTLALCNPAAVVTDETTTLYFVLNHRDVLATREIDCATFDAATYDTLLKGDGVLKGSVSAAELTSLTTYSKCTPSTTGSDKFVTVLKVEAVIKTLLETTTYKTIAENINYLLAVSTDNRLKAIGEVYTGHVGTQEAFQALCPVSGGAEMSVPFSSLHYASLDASARECTVITCRAGHSMVSGICDPDDDSTPPPSPLRVAANVAFGVTGELSAIGLQSAAIVASTNSALDTSDIVCSQICSDSNCVTCEQAKTQSRTTTLAAGRYTMLLSGSTSLTQSAASTALNAAYTTLFNSLTGLTYHSETLSVIIIDATFSDSDDGLSGGAIAGIVIGCIAFVVIVVAIVYCLCCKARDTDDDNSSQSKTHPDEA